MKKIFLLILLMTSLFGNTIEIAKDLFDNKKQYEDAFRIFKKFENNAESQYYMGKAYLYGMGIEKDLNKAYFYADKSASKSYLAGINLLGILYENGYGIEKDELKAELYYRNAAKSGNLKAMKNLANIYRNKKDYLNAEKWLIKALKGNYFDAYFDMGDMYRFNLKKYKKAIEFYEKVIPFRLDIEDLIYLHIADIYNSDLKDYKKAFEYYKKAASLDNNDALLELIYLRYTYIIPDEEYLKWLKKGVKKNLKLAYLPLYKFYLERNDIENILPFLKKSYYQDKNLEMGCYLSSFYLNLTRSKDYIKAFSNTFEYRDYKKAYTIAEKIILNNPSYNQIYICYQNLAYMYERGFYVAKDLQQAINIRKKSSQVSFDFAIKYDLIYIKEREKQLKRESLISDINSINDNKLFPVLDNFTKKENIISYLETNDYYIFSVNDKSIKIYDKESLTLIKELRAWIDTGVSGFFLKMAFDEEKKLLYTTTYDSPTNYSRNDIIKVYDIKTGKIVKPLINKNAIKNTSLEISNDGNYLVAVNSENKINIINTKTNKILHFNYENIDKFSKATIKKEKDEYFVYLLSQKNQLYTLSLKYKKEIKKEIYYGQVNFNKKFKKSFNYKEKDFNKLFKYAQNKILDLNLIEDSIEIKLQNNYLNFDFKNLKINHLNSFSNKIQKNIKPLIKFSQKFDGQLIQIIDIKKNKEREYLIGKDIKVLKTLTIENKYLLLITSDPSKMLIANLQGDIIANLQGFNTIQSNVFYYNNRLVSFGSDNVLHIFNLKNLDNIKLNPNNYDMNVINSFAKFFNQTSEELITNFSNIDESMGIVMQKQQQLSFTPTKDQVTNYFKLLVLKKEIIKPILSLFMKIERDWILYTPDGLFTYGGEGKDLLKYHQNQGLYKEAKIVENDKLFDKFYRPDLIRRVLAGEKIDIPIDVKSVILNIIPPELKILVNKMLNSKDIELTYQVCDAGNGVADTKLIINGQAISPPLSRGFSIQKVYNINNKCKVYRTIHTLYPGKSTIELKAYDKDKNIANISDKLEVNADYKIIEKSIKNNNYQVEELNNEENYTILEKPNLYLLSLAVSDYEDKNLKLKYPVKDVKSIKDKFIKNSETTFENIYTYDLYDSKVSKDSINQTFEEISKKLKINDTFVLYIAGHGNTLDGKYQFIPYKINEKISIDEIKQNLNKIAAKTNKALVLLDTCYSGSLIENIDDEATKNRLAHDSSNINYIVASSSEQVALEGYKEHGIFTYSILDAFDKNTELKVLNLAEHVSTQVPKISKEKFLYEQVPQSKLNKNFVLGN